MLMVIHISFFELDITFIISKYYCTIGTTGPDEMNLTKPLKNGFELNSA